MITVATLLLKGMHWKHGSGALLHIALLSKIICNMASAG